MNLVRSSAALLSAVMMLSPLAVQAARGVSPYLPLNLSPEIERQIERVMILADQPVMSRPIAAATVYDALPAACRIDEILCRNVRNYLQRYMRSIGVTEASLEVALTEEAAAGKPNAYGMAYDSAWQAAVRGHWQVNDHLIVSAGAVAHEDDVVPAGSMVSFGYDFAQVDVGYRERWYSPFTDSSMLVSSNAATIPSVTLSNYRPLTALGLTYELFYGEMSSSDQIAYQGARTTGRPRLGGMRVAIQPVPGWSLSANRLLQFGGGPREGGFSDFLRAMWQPRKYDNLGGTDTEFGNQAASLSSRFIFPSSTPFSVYLEYAGEDTSYEGNYRLGNAALSVGVHFPQLWQRFDLVVEASEWQNAWYTNTIYGDGLTQEGRVIGHWGGDQRVPGNGVGAQSWMVRLGWEPRWGGMAQLKARTLQNESYGAFDYERAYELGLSYARTLRGFTAGAEFIAGRDVLGDGFGRLAGFLRFGDEWSGGSSAVVDYPSRPAGAELFVDLGLAASEVTVRVGDGSPKYTTSTDVAPHVGVGARRSVTERGDLGVRAELGSVDGHMLLAVRALDYRYRFDSPLALTAFVGAARYDLATPAYGYYFGVGTQWRSVLPGFDLNLDLRYADKVARDKLLPSDPGSNPRPDSFYDVVSAALSLSYRW